MDQIRTEDHRCSTLAFYLDAARSITQGVIGITGSLQGSPEAPALTWASTPAPEVNEKLGSFLSIPERNVQIAIFLTYGALRHVIHWQSCKESKMAESSAESELFALTSAYNPKLEGI